MSNTVNNYTETDLGNISLNPRGEYDSSVEYEYLDAVSYQGGSYFCLAELETTITGIAPDAGRNSEHWQMIAAPGDMTSEYTAAYNDVINKAAQVETSRAAVELAQQEIEAVQTDVQQLHSDTVQMAQQAENSKNSAANSAQSAEQSRKTVSESEQNINGQITGFDSRVSEAVEQSKEEINTTKQQAINTITNQQTTSVNTVKTEGEKIITRVGNDAKTVADDRATVEEATQTVLNNAQEVARNAQTVTSNTENAAASAESAKTSADNAAQSAKSVEDASKQIEQNKKDVDSLKEDIVSFSEYKGLVHDWTTDKIIYTDSDAVDMVEHFSSSGKYAIVECTAGDIFTIYGTGFGKALLWCFVDINYNRITYSGSNATLLNDVIEAPENTSYLIVNCTKSGVICKGRYMEPIVKSIFDEKIRPTLLQETPYVSYRMFGAVLDGVTDDSEAVMMCHSYANKNGKKVVEHGGSLLCNFTVDVKTDCELNIEFIVNDVSPLTIYNIVSDDEKDIYYSNTFVSNQGTLTDAPEILGKFFVPRREASEWYLGRRYPSDSELEYYHRQPVVVDKLGNIISSRIYRETDGKCRFYSVKELAEKGIVFSAGKVTTTLSKIGFPRFVKCTRNNTVVKNIFVKNTSTPSLPTAYASGLIEVSECCNVVIENIVGLNNSVDMTNYSYIIDITDCYNITVKDCNITQSWGVMASHFCDTISIYNCIINRVDNHYGLFGNWTIRDCVTKYINLGYGDGTVNVDNVTFVNNTDSTADYAITTRADFNVFYCGNLIVNNVKFDGNINYIVKWIQGTQEEGYEANSGLQKKLAPTLRVYNTRLNANTALVANTIERNIPSYFYAVIGVPCTSTSLTDITAYNSELYKCYGKGKKAFYDCIIKTLTKLEADDGLLSLYNCNVKYNFNDESIDIDAYNTVFDITGEVNGNNITMVGCYAVGELVVNANKKKIINCANIS